MREPERFALKAVDAVGARAAVAERIGSTTV